MNHKEGLCLDETACPDCAEVHTGRVSGDIKIETLIIEVIICINILKYFTQIICYIDLKIVIAIIT